MDGPEPRETDPWSVSEIGEALKKARDGDRAAMARVRCWLDAHPQAWRRAGDVAAQAAQAWIALCGGTDPVSTELVTRHVAELTTRLAGPRPAPVVELLARRAATCWLQASYADAKAAECVDVPLPVARFVAERQDRAHKRLLAALAELTRLAAVVAREADDPGPPSTRPAGRPAARRFGVVGA